MTAPTPTLAEAPHAGPSQATRRVHISGLSSTLSDESLLSRFSTLRACNFHRPAAAATAATTTTTAASLPGPKAWLTLVGPAKEVERSANSLHGALWKGSKIRVGTAKPDGALAPLPRPAATLRREAARAEKKQQARERRRQRCPREEKVDRVVDLQSVKDGQHWGWHVTPASHLIRPMHMRPSHPLPPPAAASMSSGQPKRKTTSSSRSSGRARRLTIDPRRYSRTHLAGDLLDFDGGGGGDRKALQSAWVWDEEHGAWRDQHGRVEVVVVAASTPADHARDDGDDGDNSIPDQLADDPIADQLAADSISDQPDADDSMSDQLFAPQRSVSPLFDAPQRSVSPLFDAPQRSVSPLFDADAFSEGYEEDAGGSVLEEDEEAQTKRVLRELYGEVKYGEEASAAAAAAAAAAAEEESDDEEALRKLLSARAKEEPERAPRSRLDFIKPNLESGSGGGSSSAHSFTPVVRFDPGVRARADDDGEGEGEEAQPHSHPHPHSHAQRTESPVRSPARSPAPQTNQRSTLEVQKLTDMFKPQEAGEWGRITRGREPSHILTRIAVEPAPSFSLLGDLAEEDLDLDMAFDHGGNGADDGADDVESTHVANHAARAAPSDLFNPDPNLPFFFAVSKKASSAARARDPIVRLTSLSSSSSTAASIREFVRPAEEKEEERIKRWEMRKSELTREWKRRHREAVKKRKRGYEGSRRAAAA
ncbi:hypothetical protein IE81DRAFT_343064 [Ceraceosorus guamensis]|uniref:Uncharacterized protein n=1 Tax=Ceraceosorus guamensis TaxID=1522189 RepID=A0A316VRN1_9BASI|nr:hypothetical protein IE81DRAFT_343064 [Ceraceosorus guamensis]PWN39874.1 hypothetical protein IE81DRAFT_343064 [Ceraceosorus guamensis]